MTLFSQILQYAISGLTGGSIYAVLGICWSVVYLINKVLNFTTGEFVMLGATLTPQVIVVMAFLVLSTCRLIFLRRRSL
jgi:branched-subunit amino acid ABC-type transport system permease component